MASLVVTAGPAQGRSFDLERRPEVIVGRDDQCTFQVLDDQVSRRHLQVTADATGDNHIASDCGSANGVMVNGSRLNDEIALREGDRIEIGATTIVYTMRSFGGETLSASELKKMGECKRRTVQQW
jgi:pSer/pThr/pTyr-binding forkhead associated (FHA) protein